MAVQTRPKMTITRSIWQRVIKIDQNWPKPAKTEKIGRLASSDQDWTKNLQTGQNRPNLAKMATNGKIGEYLIISRPTKTCFDWPKPAKLVRTGQDRTNWQKLAKNN